MKNLKPQDFIVFLLILAIPAYILRFKIGLIPTTIFEVILYIAFTYFLVKKKLLFDIKNKKYYIPIIFVVSGLITALIDPELSRGLGLWKAYFFDGFLIYLIVSSYVKTGKAKVAYSAIDLMALLVSLAGIAIFLFSKRTPDGRLLDLDLISPNYMAMLLSPLFVFSFLRVSRGRYLTILASIFSLIAILLTGSRGAILAIGVSLIYYVVSRSRTKLTKVVSICILLVFVALIAFFYRPVWSDNGRRASSSNVRYQIWSTSLEIAKNKPLVGVGLGNYQDYFSKLTEDRVNYPEFISPQALTAHNLYLHIYLVAGVLGLLSFVALVWLSRFWRNKNVALSSSLVAILAYGLVDTPFFRNDMSTVFWILIALLTYTNMKNE